MKTYIKLIVLSLSIFSICSCNENSEDSSSTSSITSSSTITSTSSPTSTGTSSTPVSNKWQGDAYTCLVSYVGEEIPFIDGFNTSFMIGSVDGSSKPYFNPYIENSKNYNEEYKSNLLKLGFVFDGIDNSDGYDKYEYHHNDIYLSHAYYKSESKYWFDVYAFNDKDPGELQPGYKAKIIPNDFNKSYDDINKTIGSYQISSKNVMNSSSKIQFKKSEGKLVIKGENINKIVLSYSQYPQSLILKAGSSESDLKVIFNNANEYYLDNAKYVELKTPTLGQNTPRICTIYEITIY
ncbi:MAG: hypothetical protein MJ221_03395 [Bacilli bacterium]|nr:hypothetical protein [Bacilli bacterium]